MKRSSFLKSLLGIAVSPKIVSEINKPTLSSEDIKINQLVTKSAPTGNVVNVYGIGYYGAEDIIRISNEPTNLFFNKK